MAGARRCILVVEYDSETAEQLMETSPRAAATRPAAQKLRGHGQPQRRRALAKNAPWWGCLMLSNGPLFSRIIAHHATNRALNFGQFQSDRAGPRISRDRRRSASCAGDRGSTPGRCAAGRSY